MTDKEWEKVIKKCVTHGNKHLAYLKIAEDEYIRRYGNNPSEVNDDWWIDALHYCKGDINIDKIKENAEWSKK